MAKIHLKLIFELFISSVSVICLKNENYVFDMKNSLFSLSFLYSIAILICIYVYLIRVFTVHGSADEIIPVEDALEFSKIIPNHRLDIIEGADHCYSSHQAELHSIVVPIIKQCLQKMNNS